ncbi:hypothetical protein IJX73_02505 [bacterium]|nr:hypothetical protein [bacterium]
MIEKISFNPNKRVYKSKLNATPDKNKFSYSPCFGKSLSTSLKESFIKDDEIRIPNLLELEDSLDISRNSMPKGKESLNAAGLHIDVENQAGNFRRYQITNHKGDIIALAKFNMLSKELPTVIYKQGKFMPELTVKDSSLGEKSIKMMAGSELIGENFEIKMLGQFQPSAHKRYKQISFGGHSVFATCNKEANTKKAIQSYLENGLIQQTLQGDYISTVQEHKPEGLCIALGNDDRMKNITRNDENNITIKLPSDTNARFISANLNLFTMAGLINGDERDKITYLSQNHEITPTHGVYYVFKYGNDGSALAQGYARNIIDSNKDAIITNANIFTNADLTRPYHALKTLPNAALVIPYYPIDSDRAKNYILLGVEKDDNNNLQIKQFAPKSAYTFEAPDPNDFQFVEDYDEAMQKYDIAQLATLNNGKDYLVNSGMYFLSKEAVKALMAHGIVEPEKADLTTEIVPKILKLINEGKILDKKGVPMKAYSVPLERKGGGIAVWEEIGTAEAYLKLIKSIASETRLKGVKDDNKYYGIPEILMHDFLSNSDLETGIVYDSYQARIALEKFKVKHSINTIQGNIYIAGK